MGRRGVVALLTFPPSFYSYVQNAFFEPIEIALYIAGWLIILAAIAVYIGTLPQVINDFSMVRSLVLRQPEDPSMLLLILLWMIYLSIFTVVIGNACWQFSRQTIARFIIA